MENLLFTDMQLGAFIADNLGVFFLLVTAAVLSVVAYGSKAPVSTITNEVVYSSKDGFYSLRQREDDETSLEPVYLYDDQVVYEYRPLHRLKKFFW